MGPDTAGLWEGVYQAPNDDAPRAALGQYLSAAGDPRGRFIALQLQSGGLAKAQQAEARALLKAHAAQWLAAVDGVLVARSVTWERGFPVAGALNYGRSSQDRDRLVGCRAFATLRSLDLGKSNVVQPRAWCERFLWGTPLRGLETLLGLPRALLAPLSRSHPPWALQRISCPAEGGGGPAGIEHEREEIGELRQSFGVGGGLPALVDVTLSYAHGGRSTAPYAWLWETGQGRRLRVLRLNADPSALPQWHAQLSACVDVGLQELELFTASSLTLHRTSAGWTRLTGVLAPATRGRSADRIERERLDLREVLATLGGALTSIDVDGFSG